MKTIDEQLPTGFCTGVETALRNMISALIVVNVSTHHGGELDPNTASALIDSIELHRMTDAIINRANEEAYIEGENSDFTYGGSLIVIASHMAGVVGREVARNGGDVDAAINRIAGGVRHDRN